MGNRTQQTGPGGTTAYTYDTNNRLLTAGSATYTYDANGNLLTISTGQTFAWDVFNRMTQATGTGGTVTHTYNGDGLKTRRVGPDGTRNYYYDGIKPIWETDGAGVMTAQLDRDIFGNLLSRREASGARRYYHFDGLGSTTALTNETGTVTATLLYDAWGNQRAATGSDQGRYRFTGAELDSATGLYHMGARFYDPTIGRWLSEDPVQDKPFEPLSLNFYAYVQNNPGILVDPDGRAAALPMPGYYELVQRAALLVVLIVTFMSSSATAPIFNFAGRGADPTKVTAGLMGAVAKHLANITGSPVGPEDPKKKSDDERTKEKWRNDIRSFLDQVKERIGSDWKGIERALRKEGWTDAQIQQMLQELRRQGIEPSNWFTGVP